LLTETALARLMKGLRREPHDYRSSLQVFADLNVVRLASVAVVDRIEAEKKSAQGVLLDEQRVYTERLTGLDFEARFALIEQAAPEAIGSLRAEAAQGPSNISPQRADTTRGSRDKSTPASEAVGQRTTVKFTATTTNSFSTRILPNESTFTG
jgi:hypothetical protein